jgi:hypothetical protein
MRLMTEREQLRWVAASWARQYPRGGRSTAPDKAAIQKLLDALDVERATADDVASIIGNTSWVQPKECNECGVESWLTVELGEEPDYESRTAFVCVGCLRAALVLAEQVAP